MVTFEMVFSALGEPEREVLCRRETLEPFVYSVCDASRAVPAGELRDDVLYIVTPELLPALLLKGVTNIVAACRAGGAELPLVDDINLGLVTLPAGVTPEELADEAGGIVGSLKSWAIRMFDMVMEGGGLQELINAAYSVIGCPIMLSDVFLTRIAYTRDPVSMEIWDDIMDMWTAPQDRLSRAGLLSYVSQTDSEHKKLTGHINSKRKYLFTREAGFAHLSGLISINDSTVGHLIMICPSLDKTRIDRDYFNVLYSVCRLALQCREPSRTGGGIVWEYFILDLLGDTHLSEDAVNDMLARLSWNPLKYYYVLAVTQHDMDMPMQLLDAIRGRIAEALPHATCLLYGGGVVVLVNTRNDYALSEAQRGKVGAILREHGMKCGISLKYDRLLETRKAYNQAVYAADNMYIFAPDRTFSLYSDFILEHVFDELLKIRRAEDLIHPGLRRLMEADDEKGSELMKTLECYLRCEKNQVAAARELYIQRSSLAYRLRKIEELAGIRLSDGDTMLHLLISLKLLSKRRMNGWQ